MANVWLARVDGAGGFQKTVVVKTILPHLADDPEFVRMFIDEAIVASRIQHPNVVNIFDLGETEGFYFIAMEYIPGRTLRHVQREVKRTKRAPPPWFILRIIASACDGLHHAHTMVDDDGKPMHIVHRDVSPENIMVSFTGDTKVLDFGIAKASNIASKTRAGVLKGKHAYMAPEQIEGAAEGRAPHPRVDVYSMGVVLYELLTGRRPFRAPNELALLRLILDTVPPPPHQVCAWVTEPLSNLVMKAMHRDPNRRFQSALDFRAAIDNYLQSSGSFPTRGHVANYLKGLFGDVSTPGRAERTPISGSRRSSPGGTGRRDSHADDPWQTSEDLGSPVTIDLSMVLCSEDEVPESEAGRANPPPTPTPGNISAPATPDEGWDDQPVLTIDVLEEFESPTLDTAEEKSKRASAPATGPQRTPPKPPNLPPTSVEPSNHFDPRFLGESKGGSSATVPAKTIPRTAPTATSKKAPSTPPAQVSVAKSAPTDDIEMPRPSTGGKGTATTPAVPKKSAADDIEMPGPSTGGKGTATTPAVPKKSPPSAADDIEMPRPSTGGKGTATTPAVPKKSPPSAADDIEMPRPSTGGKGTATTPAVPKKSPSAADDIEMPRPSTGGKGTATTPAVPKKSPPSAADDIEMPRPSTGGKGTATTPAVPKKSPSAADDIEMPRSSTSGTVGKVSKAAPRPTPKPPAPKSPERSPENPPKKGADSSVHLWDVLTKRVRAERESEAEPSEKKSGSAVTLGPEAVALSEPMQPTPTGAHAWDLVVGRIRSSSIADGEIAETKNREPERPRKASDWFDEGLKHWREKNFEGTLECWSRAFEMDPDNRRYESNLRKLKDQMSKRKDNR
jgi:serine/threonine-protein kinase